MFNTEIKDGTTLVRMSHGKANAMDLEFLLGLAELFQELKNHRSGPVILTGTGRIFSAGVDLPRLLDESTEYVDSFLPALEKAFSAVFFHPQPVIAAINGHAIAGGCVLVQACDRRLMTKSQGKIGVPEIKVGVPFPFLALEILRFAVPGRHLQEVVLRGDNYPPPTAEQMGLVDRCVETEQLLDEALSEARALQELPARPFELAKLQIRNPVRRVWQTEGSAHDAQVAKLWTAPGTRDIIRGYLEATLGSRS